MIKYLCMTGVIRRKETHDESYHKCFLPLDFIFIGIHGWLKKKELMLQLSVYYR